ncbi:Gfo/Idh/MocA family oxidoreductase [Alteromonadaceae bacterium BrNp21-10]|nr:Gfo/Idh/MocA family oxidoreductase [Alteromonadaceae bacterium BrNp21-10]
MKKPPQIPQAITRRQFLNNSVIGLGALGFGALTFSNLAAAKKKDGKKLGIALVGLGNYSRGQLGPALLETQDCYLAAIVTGTKSKEKIWQEKYNIPDKNVYNYDNFDDIANNDDVDIIYVVLPNSMHAEYSIRAAKAGKHVISEKPMAVSVAECQQVIDACKKHNVKLGIGYRLHHDPFNLEMMRLGQHQVYGQVKNVQADFCFKMNDRTQWRADKKFSGGGPLMDIGIYCIQGAIYTLGELPISVSARDTTIDKAAWKTVEGSLEWTFKFKSGAVVHSKSSYEQDYYGKLVATADKGEFGLGPAYVYGNLKGYTPEGEMNFTAVNQQAQHMDAFANNVLHNTETLAPGEMGLRDMFIIEKIYQSIEQGGKELSLAGIPNILHKV